MNFEPLFPTVLLKDYINDELKNNLLDLCNKYTDMTQTNLLGIKHFPSTLQNWDLSLLVNNEPIVQQTFEIIINYYLKTFLEARGQPFDKETFNPYGFFSNMKKGAYLRKHSHTDCRFSGIIYLDIGEDVPDLIFHDPRPYVMFEPTRYSSNTTIPVAPENNLLLIWDHWLEHEIREKTNDNPRKVFTFNV